MINIRFIANLIGRLMLIESACFLLCVIISLIYGEHDSKAFAISAVITAVTGVFMV